MSLAPEQTGNLNINSENENGFFKQSGQRMENNQNSTPFDLTYSSMQQIKKKKRGRPSNLARLHTGTSSPQMSGAQSKLRKIQNIRAYQIALKKLRASYNRFYSPFEIQQLKIDKNAQIQTLKKAMKNIQERALESRLLIRSVGIRHERNLFKNGVKQQLGYIIQYLETGKVPKDIKYQFRQLMDKDFSNVHETAMYPTLL